jgi:hypothetical protein
MHRQAGAKLPADTEGDARWIDATERNKLMWIVKIALNRGE